MSVGLTTGGCSCLMLQSFSPPFKTLLNLEFFVLSSIKDLSTW